VFGYLPNATEDRVAFIFKGQNVEEKFYVFLAVHCDIPVRDMTLHLLKYV